MKKVYTIEQRGYKFFVPKRDAEGKMIPKIHREYGHIIPGEFEMHECDFKAAEMRKHSTGDGFAELVQRCVFIVDDKTPPEIAAFVEKLHADKVCELEAEYIARINPAQAKALAERDALAAEAEKYRSEDSKNKATIERLQADIERLKQGKR